MRILSRVRVSAICACIVAFLAVGRVARAAEVIPLWSHGAPGFEARRTEAETAKDWWIRNVHNPSLTVFRPAPGKGNGTAVVICPGGGHRELVFNAEGVEPAEYLAKLGITAFALKYRLARETGSPYTLEEHVSSDIHRAMRLVRSNAALWNLDPNRIGVMGWSAGAELAAMVAYRPSLGDATAADPVDRVSAAPNFQIIIYPGSYGIPDELPAAAPPAFLLAAMDDEHPAQTVLDLADKYRKLGLPVEMHLIAQGGHAFNMGQRSKYKAVRDWPQRLADWLEDRELLQRAH
ncbi:MAG: alpha/beta hydrolase [Povalibacter sp.]